MNKLVKLSAIIGTTMFIGLIVAVVGMIALYSVLAAELPPIDTAEDFALEVPLRIYSREGALIAEFGEQRRDPVPYSELPQPMIDAFLAAEDDRFFEHPGVDWQGLVRAVVSLITTGQRQQGGSTITMQLARNFFLSPEKSYKRKLLEIFLALKIEAQLDKEKILELYLNKIYLGKRAYGVSAAAQVYYDRSLAELTLAQTAMIAGLPKAPSKYNPIVNPTRALQRRDYVLRRMLELDRIDQATYDLAVNESISAHLSKAEIELEAPYAAELVRSQLIQLLGSDIYRKGYQVYTTLETSTQTAATTALRTGLEEYDRRHGWRGAERRVDLSQLSDETSRDEFLEDLPKPGGLSPALVVLSNPESAKIYLGSGRYEELTLDAVKWAKPFIDNDKVGEAPTRVNQVLKAGDLIRVAASKDGLQLAQIPKVQGALVAVDPNDGAIVAMEGGYDFNLSKFNRATQAWRQPGSGFKPILYASALAKGFTPATTINDAPVVFDDPALERAWRPENDSGKFYGPTRLREALYRSRNLVSIRLLREVGIPYVIDYAEGFGLPPNRLPKDLTLALGSLTATPMKMAEAYTALANGGVHREPYLIQRVESPLGEVLFQTEILEADQEPEEPIELGNINDEPEEPAGDSLVAADDSERVEITAAEPETLPIPQPAKPTRVMDLRTWYQINSMMKDVINRGTGYKAKQLGRNDLAGKTGTTNDQNDAWFNGFNSELVAISWVGFDQLQTLGKGEFGGVAALPIWMKFMSTALNGVPDLPTPEPPEMVSVKISPETGERVSASDPDGIFETFRAEYLPPEATTASGRRGEQIVEELF